MASDMLHDEWARCAFAMALRSTAFRAMQADMPGLNRNLVTPAFARRHGRAPAEPLEVMAELEDFAPFQMLTGILVTAQDLLWASSADVVDRNLSTSVARFRETSAQAKGSLRLNPGLPVPDYLAAADTHRMPGSFYTETGADDVRAGAIYDLGGAIYQMANGRTGNGLFLNDGRGHVGAALLMNEFPDLAPKRILDMGCTVGHSTLPYVDYFPDAELHAIDACAPVLRFAHARAEALGKPVHFSQQDAEATEFPADSFDVVMSHILLHETSPKAVARIFKESHRILRPGGVMMHLEVPFRAEHRDPAALPFLLWEKFYNTEPNLAMIAQADFIALMKEAGFLDPLLGYFPQTQDARTCRSRLTATLPAGPSWLAMCARKD
jgi:ubiquinone/menaquinone biosynthesis C-methylase UbiE